MEPHGFLQQALVYLAAGVIAVPLSRRLGLGSVLGYLVAGVLIGPWGLALISDARTVLQFSELGVVMLLYLFSPEELRGLFARLGYAFDEETQELTELNSPGTEAYITYRLGIAGAQRTIFKPETYPLICHYSKGIPRLINTICDNALLETYLRKQDRIEMGLIHEVAEDLKLSG
jgi:hypothetical protein